MCCGFKEEMSASDNHSAKDVESKSDLSAFYNSRKPISTVNFEATVSWSGTDRVVAEDGSLVEKTYRVKCLHDFGTGKCRMEVIRPAHIETRCCNCISTGLHVSHTNENDEKFGVHVVTVEDMPGALQEVLEKACPDIRLVGLRPIEFLELNRDAFIEKVFGIGATHANIRRDQTGKMIVTRDLGGEFGAVLEHTLDPNCDYLPTKAEFSYKFNGQVRTATSVFEWGRAELGDTAILVPKMIKFAERRDGNIATAQEVNFRFFSVNQPIEESEFAISAISTIAPGTPVVWNAHSAPAPAAGNLFWDGTKIAVESGVLNRIAGVEKIADASAVRRRMMFLVVSNVVLLAVFAAYLLWCKSQRAGRRS